MQYTKIPHTDLETSTIIYGCMRAAGGWHFKEANAEAVDNTRRVVDAALEAGINFFDHADIYCAGVCESAFGKVLAERPELRDSMIIQTKCGIRFANTPEAGMPGRYDFSYDHIVESAEASLRRLGVDTIDVYLLHRPDPLVEPEEVARAFDHLEESGKVRYFGVSNHSGHQIDLLRKYLNQPLVTNQLEVSLLHTCLIDPGTAVNQNQPQWSTPGEGTLEYCRIHDISVQSWSPLAQGRLGADTVDDLKNPDHKELYSALHQMAEAKGVSVEAVLLAWVLRHPAKIQPIIGTTQAERIHACAAACEITLSREEWNTLYILARGKPMG